jgi:hypothetical protein
MYFTHVVFGMGLNWVAVAHRRDRSAVVYACYLIENRRDDSKENVCSISSKQLYGRPQPRFWCSNARLLKLATLPMHPAPRLACAAPLL